MKLTLIATLFGLGLLAALVGPPHMVEAVFGEERGIEREDQDHERAYDARQGGAILSLSQVLALVTPKIGSEILETEFENEDGRPIYEFKYVDPSGRVREIYVDARTGAVLGGGAE
jgi:uncharacterized membrane protein YkoI